MARYGLGTQIRASIPMIKALRREIMIVLIVFLLGVLVGWLALGWGIAPVQWTEAAPVHLHPSHRDFYLRLVATAYSNGDITIDDVRTYMLQNWDIDGALTELDRLAAGSDGGIYSDLIDALDFLKSQGPGAATETGPPSDGQTSPLVYVLLLAAVVAIAFFSITLVRRASRSAQTQAVGGVGSVSRAGAVGGVGQALAWPGESEAPLRQFTMTYVLGDDRFDMSNAIETQGGMFLGECGMGISETIGTPEPSKVTAFEVWLFDKNDIRTVTSVLMSDHAFNDPTLKGKLAAKGDAILADPGAPIALETATLRVRARVTEMEYGSGQLPPSSFFQRLQVVMAAWPIGDSGVTRPGDVLSM